MTEKRFKIADYPTDIIDTENGKEYPCSSYWEHMDGICDLLNALDTEKEELKHKVHKYSLQIIAMDNRIIELEKKNKKLEETVDHIEKLERD